MSKDEIMEEFDKEFPLTFYSDSCEAIKAFFLAKFTQLAKECIPEECHCPDDHSIGFKRCITCNGSGRIINSSKTNTNMLDYVFSCPDCRGNGIVAIIRQYDEKE